MLVFVGSVVETFNTAGTFGSSMSAFFGRKTNTGKRQERQIPVKDKIKCRLKTNYFFT
jgi:hypothetical protein